MVRKQGLSTNCGDSVDVVHGFRINKIIKGSR